MIEGLGAAGFGGLAGGFKGFETPPSTPQFVVGFVKAHNSPHCPPYNLIATLTESRITL